MTPGGLRVAMANTSASVAMASEMLTSNALHAPANAPPMQQEGHGVEVLRAAQGEVDTMRSWLTERQRSTGGAKRIPFSHHIAGTLESAIERGPPSLALYLERTQICAIPLSDIESKAEQTRRNVFERVKCLLEGGASGDNRDENGYSALLRASASGNIYVVELLLRHGVAIDGVNMSGETALVMAVKRLHFRIVLVLLAAGADPNHVLCSAHGRRTALDIVLETSMPGRPCNAAEAVYPVAFLLCSFGGKFAEALPGSATIESYDHGKPVEASHAAEQWWSGMRACTEYWQQCYDHRLPLTDVPCSIIEAGEGAVRSFIANVVDESDTIRANVCFVGPTKSGRSSLFNSLLYQTPWSVLESMECTSVERSYLTVLRVQDVSKRFDMIVEDLSGLPYQRPIALVPNDHTLFVICVDLAAYNSLLKNEAESQQETRITRFLLENVGRVVELVLHRKPAAHFLVLGTKSDMIDSTTLEELRSHFEGRMHPVAYEMISRISPEVEGPIRFQMVKRLSECHPVSVMTTADTDAVRRIIVDTVAAVDASKQVPEVGYPLRGEAVQILRKVRAWGTEHEPATASSIGRGQIGRSIVRQCALCERLRCETIVGFDHIGNIVELLRLLHRLGDIMWCEDSSQPLSSLVVINPLVICTLIDELLNVRHAQTAHGPQRASLRDGVVKHEVAIALPSWQVLDNAGEQFTRYIKSLMQSFGLVHLCEVLTSQEKPNLIVTALWKNKHHRSESRLDRSLALGRSQARMTACWEYILPPGVSEILFDRFVLHSHRPFGRFIATATYMKSVWQLNMLATGSFTKNERRGTDSIRIQVSAQRPQLAWEELRFFVMVMEQVLEEYPPLRNISRQVIHVAPNGDEQRYDVEQLIKEFRTCTSPSAAKLLRETVGVHDELPEDILAWFESKGWRAPDGLRQAQQNQLHHKLSVLQNLVVSTDNVRRAPADFSITRTRGGGTLQVRFYSDLSGLCFHNPIEISVSRLGDFAKYIKVGTTLLSMIPSSVVPSRVAEVVVDVVTEGLTGTKAYIDRVEAIHGVVQKLHIEPGGNQTSADLKLTPEDSMTLLDLLLPDVDICSVTHLRLAATKHAIQTANGGSIEAGVFVFAHEEEIKRSKDCLVQRDPSVLLSSSAPPGVMQLYAFTVEITGATGFPEKKWRFGSTKMFANWEIESEKAASQLKAFRGPRPLHGRQPHHRIS